MNILKKYHFTIIISIPSQLILLLNIKVIKKGYTYKEINSGNGDVIN